MEVRDCTEVYSRFNNASARANKGDGLPTARFLGQTFHGLAIQISNEILTASLLFALARHSIALVCTTCVQYSIRANTTSECYVLQLVSLSIVGSVGFRGVLNTAYRLCKALLGYSSTHT
jgi:hypothetical protein